MQKPQDDKNSAVLYNKYQGEKEFSKSKIFGHPKLEAKGEKVLKKNHYVQDISKQRSTILIKLATTAPATNTYPSRRVCCSFQKLAQVYI